MDDADPNDDREMNRRDFLAWTAAMAAALALPGCRPDQAYAPRPRQRSHAYAHVPPPEPRYIYVQTQPQFQAAPQTARLNQAAGGKVSAMSRNSWGAAAAVPAKMKAMNGITRITVHHEGSNPNNDAAASNVAAGLRLIQSQHRKRMGAGDIGYHFIIDRTGVIWQGRDWKYQGAHVSSANAHNLGVMLLGNFETQKPTSAQLASLTQLSASLMRKFGLSRSDVYGHSDFSSTKCPGKNLKPYVIAMRKSLNA